MKIEIVTENKVNELIRKAFREKHSEILNSVNKLNLRVMRLEEEVKYRRKRK